MLEFMSANASNILAGLAVALLFSAAVIKLVRDRKKGRRDCSCGCSGCAFEKDCRGGQKRI